MVTARAVEAWIAHPVISRPTTMATTEIYDDHDPPIEVGLGSDDECGKQCDLEAPIDTAMLGLTIASTPQHSDSQETGAHEA